MPVLQLIPELEIRIRNGRPFIKSRNILLASPFKMYRKFVITNWICSAKWSKNGQWQTIISSCAICCTSGTPKIYPNLLLMFFICIITDTCSHCDYGIFILMLFVYTNDPTSFDYGI